MLDHSFFDPKYDRTGTGAIKYRNLPETTIPMIPTREEALFLLKEYNTEPFHIKHALTVEGVMRYFAKELGYTDEEEFCGIVGLLHDLDFEKYPEQHCVKERF